MCNHKFRDIPVAQEPHGVIVCDKHIPNAMETFVPKRFFREAEWPDADYSKVVVYAAPVAQEPVVPSGWKLVPVEPTPEMNKAADDGDLEYSFRYHGNSNGPIIQQSGEDHWAAMIAVSPAAPVAAQEQHHEFDDCTAKTSPTGKHSESWFANGDCEYCKAGAQPNAPLFYAQVQPIPAVIEARAIADELEKLMLEIANGERKPQKLPTEPIVRAYQVLRKMATLTQPSAQDHDAGLADTQRAIIEAAERRGYERAIADCAQVARAAKGA